MVEIRITENKDGQFVIINDVEFTEEEAIDGCEGCAFMSAGEPIYSKICSRVKCQEKEHPTIFVPDAIAKLKYQRDNPPSDICFLID